jgi:hypothetical protein
VFDLGGLGQAQGETFEPIGLCRVNPEAAVSPACVETLIAPALISARAFTLPKWAGCATTASLSFTAALDSPKWSR